MTQSLQYGVSSVDRTHCDSNVLRDEIKILYLAQGLYLEVLSCNGLHDTKYRTYSKYLQGKYFKHYNITGVYLYSY